MFVCRDSLWKPHLVKTFPLLSFHSLNVDRLVDEKVNVGSIHLGKGSGSQSVRTLWESLTRSRAGVPMSKHLCEESLQFHSPPDLLTVFQQADRLDYSLRRFFVDEFYTRYVSLLKTGSRVLDLGGHKICKRGAFDIGQYPLRVIYANQSRERQPDLQSDAAHLPCKYGSFDAVICAELLEHVHDPLAVLREVYGVLQSQGIVLISAPFLHQIHADPYDYGRYTDHYWRENLAKIGFTDIVIEKQGLFWSVMVDMLRGWAYENVREGHPRSAWLRRQVANVIAKGKRLALARDGRPGQDHHPFFSRYTTGFGIRAIRP